MVTVGTLINSIWNEFGNDARMERNAFDGIVRYGRVKGWLEEQDELYSEWNLDRRSAARIIHNFMKIECAVKDIRDWDNAKRLKDLYDCRVCANHIAQVVEQKIMLPIDENRFGLLDKVTDEELELIVCRMKQVIA